MRKDAFVAAAYEAGLLSLAALLGYLFHTPLIFASLGPTAFEMVEMPKQPSAQPYNVLVGHGVGILAGLAALGMTRAYLAPAVSVHGVPLARVVAVLIAGFLTVVGTLLLKATQPASLSTTLLCFGHPADMACRVEHRMWGSAAGDGRGADSTNPGTRDPLIRNSPAHGLGIAKGRLFITG